MKRARISIATILAILIAGCADTTRDPNVHYSGFLGDYSDLVKGDDEQAERRYLRPHVDWAPTTEFCSIPSCCGGATNPGTTVFPPTKRRR